MSDALWPPLALRNYTSIDSRTGVYKMGVNGFRRIQYNVLITQSIIISVCGQISEKSSLISISWCEDASFFIAVWLKTELLIFRINCNLTKHKKLRTVTCYAQRGHKRSPKCVQLTANLIGLIGHVKDLVTHFTSEGFYDLEFAPLTQKEVGDLEELSSRPEDGRLAQLYPFLWSSRFLLAEENRQL